MLSSSSRRAPWIWLQVALVLVAGALFARLSVRYVGESVFLADQVDQLQNFERLLQFEPDGLWGPIYGQSEPPARTLGPLGGILAGVPVRLGLGVDANHALTSLLLVATTIAAFFGLLRLDPPLAWCWLMLLLSSIAIWWNVAMHWSNTVLPSIGCLALLGMALALERPSLARSLALVLLVWFGLEIHLVALPVAAAVGIVLLVTLRDAFRRLPTRRQTLALAVVALLAFGPYLVAELMTGFANSAAVLGHTPGEKPTDPAVGRATFAQVLQLAADPTEFWTEAGLSGWAAVVLAGVIAVAALGGWLLLARTATSSGAPRPLVASRVVWLIVASLAAVIVQALFFLALNRELLGRHYTLVLAPFFVVPPAALAAAVVRRFPSGVQSAIAPALGVACVALVLFKGPEWADRYAERTDWSFTRIHAAVTQLCGDGRARTVEGPGFLTHAPGHDPVLQFLMTRRLVDCQYDPTADRLLAGGVNMEFPETRTEPDGTFQLERVLPPGIASYRRVP